MLWGWTIWKYLASHRYIVGKRRGILITLFDNCGYSMILHQNFTSDSFLKISCNLEFETLSEHFILYYYKISYWISYIWIDTLPIHELVKQILFIRKILLTWVTPLFLILTNFMKLFFKNPICYYHHWHHWTSAEVLETCQSRGSGSSFPNF